MKFSKGAPLCHFTPMQNCEGVLVCQHCRHNKQYFDVVIERRRQRAKAVRALAKINPKLAQELM